MNGVTKVIHLIEAICRAWTKCLPPPYGTGEYSSAIDGRTDCNRFTNEVIMDFGYTKFLDFETKRVLLANQMYVQMMENGDWIEIDGITAQNHANAGAVVVAAWDNPAGHGHVCIVRPGIAEASSTWGIKEPRVPKVANVGEPATCRIDKKASFAFSAAHMPKYFALVKTLD